MIQIDVSHHTNVVWGVNRAHSIWQRGGIQGHWRNIDGKLKHVSVGGAGIWGVNNADQIYFRTGVTPNNQAGTGWLNIQGNKFMVFGNHYTNLCIDACARFC